MQNRTRKLIHPVPIELLTQIGDITVSFAMLELQIKSLIWSLIGGHQRIGQIITSELAFKNLLALVISLYIERCGEDDDGEKLKELMKKAGKIGEKRNQVTHSVWASGKTPNTITRFKTSAKQGHGYQAVFEEYDKEKLIDLANEIKILASNIQLFSAELIDNGKAINNPLGKL